MSWWTTAAPRSKSERPAWAQLLIAMSPLSLVLLSYAIADWINATIAVEPGTGATTNRLGFDLQVGGPAAADRALFGVVPTVWLQDRLVDSPGDWYDVAASLTYVTHFLVLPVVTAWVWFRRRERIRSWYAGMLMLTAVGMVLYVMYPAAAPWLGSQYGAIGQVDRLPGRGWEILELDLVWSLLGDALRGGNPVAAMPSLHAATPMLLALFFWNDFRKRGRIIMILYVVTMAVTLIYTGEHYAIDVLAGWVVAVLAMFAALASSALSRRRKDNLIDGPGWRSR
ncbi:phosphatase PAP2 family protein [Kribbella albertanoniae]|uniref:Inositol phosphorylceramide synthase n=1 Tax=Kribbella albertanoniae TaxID=1266829 RepID=A0A4R4P9F8_9ACTN|nr:phosphatase PAP2 family protein [Kribbella albertanoniae]TDC18699.1 inositol phosphorylceramide synthase [Kribbella albertanoniae]